MSFPWISVWLHCTPLYSCIISFLSLISTKRRVISNWVNEWSDSGVIHSSTCQFPFLGVRYSAICHKLLYTKNKPMPETNPNLCQPAITPSYMCTAAFNGFSFTNRESRKQADEPQPYLRREHSSHLSLLQPQNSAHQVTVINEAPLYLELDDIKEMLHVKKGNRHTHTCVGITGDICSLVSVGVDGHEEEQVVQLVWQGFWWDPPNGVGFKHRCIKTQLHVYVICNAMCTRMGLCVPISMVWRKWPGANVWQGTQSYYLDCSMGIKQSIILLWDQDSPPVSYTHLTLPTNREV